MSRFVDPGPEFHYPTLTKSSEQQAMVELYEGAVLDTPPGLLVSRLCSHESDDPDQLLVLWLAHTLRAEAGRYDPLYRVERGETKQLRDNVVAPVMRQEEHLGRVATMMYDKTCHVGQLGFVLTELHPHLDIRYGTYRSVVSRNLARFGLGGMLLSPNSKIQDVRQAVTNYQVRGKEEYYDLPPDLPADGNLMGQFRYESEAQLFETTRLPRSAPESLRDAWYRRMASVGARHDAYRTQSEHVADLERSLSRPAFIAFLEAQHGRKMRLW